MYWTKKISTNGCCLKYYVNVYRDNMAYPVTFMTVLMALVSLSSAYGYYTQPYGGGGLNVSIGGGVNWIWWLSEYVKAGSPLLLAIILSPTVEAD